MAKDLNLPKTERELVDIICEYHKQGKRVYSDDLANRTGRHRLEVARTTESLRQRGFVTIINLPDGEAVLQPTGDAIEAVRQYKREKRARIFRIVATFLATSALIPILALIFEVTQAAPVLCFYFGILCPEPTPTAVIPTPTSGIRVAQEGEILVLVAQFRGAETIDVTSRIVEKLDTEVRAAGLTNVYIAKLPYIVEDSTTAQELGEYHKATIVIWGWYDSVGSTAHFETIGDHERIKVARQESRESEEVSVQEATSKPSSKSAIYFRQELPEEMTYFTSFAIGQLYYWDEQFDKALPAFTTAIHNAEGKDQLTGLEAVYFYRGYVYGSIRDQPEEAIEDYEAAIKLKPDFIEAYNNLGNEYSNLGEYDLALEKYNKALEIDPDFASAYNNRGNVYRDLGEYDQAIADYDRAVQLDPDDADPYANRGLTYYHLKDYRRAIQDYDKAIGLDPKHAGAYNNRAVAYIELGDLDEALDDLNQAIKLDPNLAIAYNNRGVVYDRLGRHAEAIADYDKAVELNQELAIAFGNRGLSNLGLGRYEQAVIDYSKALDLDPQNGEYYISRGRAYLALEKYSEAIVDFGKSIEFDSSNANAYAERGRAYHASNENDKALADYNKAIEIDHKDPGMAGIYNNRGNIFSDRRQYDRAVSDYTSAIELDAELAIAYYNRGLVFRIRGEKKKAVTDFQRYLELTPDADNKEEVGKWIRELQSP
jgi:tetratricopeptide (TPR) repeat protein